MLLQELRQQTSEQHLRLEQELAIEDRLRDLESYRELLKRFYGWWVPWEARVDASNDQALLGFFEPRRKRQKLRADLLYLGLTACEVNSIELAHVRELKTEAQILGSMYVTEGSTLGGQVITRMIEQKLGLSDGHGYSFYRSYGVQVGSMWREFGTFAQNRVAIASHDEAIESARETFEELRVWLSGRR